MAKDDFFSADRIHRGKVFKLRSVVIILSVVLLLVVGTLVLQLTQPQFKDSFLASLFQAQPQDAEATVQPDMQLKEVWVAKNRIEPGVLLNEEMFASRAAPEHLLPAGAIVYSEGQKLFGNYAKQAIEANGFATISAVAERSTSTPFEIPPGFRATSIYVDSRTAIEGFAKPNTRVDLLWLYKDSDDSQKVTTIVRNAKVLSLAGVTDPTNAAPMKGAATTVTLLVTERDSKVVELARATGTMSLALIGDSEASMPMVYSDNPRTDAVSMRQILGNAEEPVVPGSPEYNGVCVTSDPHAGTQVKYVFDNDRWVEKSDVEVRPLSRSSKKQGTPTWVSRYIPTTARARM